MILLEVQRFQNQTKELQAFLIYLVVRTRSKISLYKLRGKTISLKSIFEDALYSSRRESQIKSFQFFRLLFPDLLYIL